MAFLKFCKREKPRHLGLEIPRPQIESKLNDVAILFTAAIYPQNIY